MNDRYKNQTRLVRTYRWLRWKPLYAGIAGLHILWWVLRGAKPIIWADSETHGGSLFIRAAEVEIHTYTETRCSTLGHIWQSQMSIASFKMRNYVTADEWLARL